MKSKTEIKEVKTDSMCPECNVALKFECIVLSKDQIEEQKRYYKKLVRMWIFRHLRIGPTLRQYPNAMEMRCPKCQKLYHVESDGIK